MLHPDKEDGTPAREGGDGKTRTTRERERNEANRFEV